MPRKVERIIYVYEPIKPRISNQDILDLHQDHNHGSPATIKANSIRHKAKFLITVDKNVKFKDYEIMFVAARGPNLKSSDKDKKFFLSKDLFKVSTADNLKTRVEVCLEKIYYNQLLAAKMQGADAFVFTLLSNGYYAAKFKKDEDGRAGMGTISRRAAQTAIKKFNANYPDVMEIVCTVDLTEMKKGHSDSLDLAGELIQTGCKNVAVGIAGADNSGGGATHRVKPKYDSRGELPKTQEENVKCRTNWDNSQFQNNTRIIRINPDYEKISTHARKIQNDFFDASQKVKILNHITTEAEKINTGNTELNDLNKKITDLKHYIEANRVALSQYRGIVPLRSIATFFGGGKVKSIEYINDLESQLIKFKERVNHSSSQPRR